VFDFIQVLREWLSNWYHWGSISHWYRWNFIRHWFFWNFYRRSVLNQAPALQENHSNSAE